MPWAGAVRDYLCRLSPTHYGTVVGVMRDVTRERQALRDLEEQALELARSNQALEQFATIASHDLQEPLRTVAEYTRMVQEDHGEDLSEEAERAISLAIAGADRMKSLVQDLLEYARAGAEAGMEDVHCDEVLDEALELLGSAVSHAGATVRREPLPVVRGNRNRLTQLFLNLLGNAVKFGGAEPVVVEMGARDEGTHWSFFVRDNGIGFDAAEAEAIFRPFHRLHPATRFAGNGIGLALCRRIVEHHGGTIRADSEPGRGTTLTFTIPR